MQPRPVVAASHLEFDHKTRRKPLASEPWGSVKKPGYPKHRRTMAVSVWSSNWRGFLPSSLVANTQLSPMILKDRNEIELDVGLESFYTDSNGY